MQISYIPKPENGRRFVIADVHGCNLTLQTLVTNQLQLTKQDQLFCLGDYVSRGTDSLGVLEYLMALQETGYQLFALRGNHEQMLIEKLKMRDRVSDNTRLIGGGSLVRQINTAQRAWVEALPYFFELDKFYLVHGAINTQAEKPLEDTEYMLWERKTKNASAFLKGKQLIHGHTIHAISEIRQAIEERHDCIPLDNGCYKGCKGQISWAEEGSLCALELDAWRLYVQENVD